MSTAKRGSAAPSSDQQVASLLHRLLARTGAQASDILGEADASGIDLVTHAQPIMDGMIERRRHRGGAAVVADQFKAMASRAEAMSQADHDRFATFVTTGLTGRPSDSCRLVGQLVAAGYPLLRHLDALSPILVDVWRRAQDEDRIGLMRSVTAISHQEGDQAAGRAQLGTFTSTVLRTLVGKSKDVRNVSLSGPFAYRSFDTVAELLTPETQTRYPVLADRFAYVTVLSDNLTDRSDRFATTLATVVAHGCARRPFAQNWWNLEERSSDEIITARNLLTHPFEAQMHVQRYAPRGISPSYPVTDVTVTTLARCALGDHWAAAAREGWGHPRRSAAAVLWLEEDANDLPVTGRGDEGVAERIRQSRVVAARTVALGLLGPSPETGFDRRPGQALASCAQALGEDDDARLIIRLAVIGDRLRGANDAEVSRGGESLLAAIGGQETP